MRSMLRVALGSFLVALAVSCASVDEDAVVPIDDETVGERVSAEPAAGAVEDLQLSSEDIAALEVFGQQCGPVVCTGLTHCCNASCGRCVPFGVECTQEACLTGEPATE